MLHVHIKQDLPSQWQLPIESEHGQPDLLWVDSTMRGGRDSLFVETKN